MFDPFQDFSGRWRGEAPRLVGRGKSSVIVVHWFLTLTTVTAIWHYWKENFNALMPSTEALYDAYECYGSGNSSVKGLMHCNGKRDKENWRVSFVETDTYIYQSKYALCDGYESIVRYESTLKLHCNCASIRRSVVLIWLNCGEITVVENYNILERQINLAQHNYNVSTLCKMHVYTVM